MQPSELEKLGIDVEQFSWQNLSLCNKMDTRLFFDDYEADDNVANMIDELCLSCPIMTQCLQSGLDNSEWGVWGGVFLISGKPDKSRNSHKSPETWDAIRSRIG